MPTERPQQAHLFWLVSALAVFLIVAWQPAFGVAFLVGLALGALALALAHDYCAVALPGWGWPRRAALVLTCGALGVAAFLVWPVAPLPPAAALLALVITYQWQRGRWPNAVDRLTGLPTAAAFAARGEEELARGFRFGRPAVVAVVALDNANEVLALHGRDSLDRALRRVADLLRQHSRGYDLLGRLDDARFALLLPETNGDEAAAVVERLRAAIGQLQSAPADGGATIRLAASVGLAIHPRGGDTVRALVHRADSIARGLDGASDAAGTGANGRAAAPPKQPSVAMNAPIAVRRFVAPAWSVPVYIGAVWLATAAIFIATFSFEPQPHWWSVATLLAIGVISRQSRIPLYGRGSISNQFVPLMAASILFGPTYSMLLGAGIVALVPRVKNVPLRNYIFDAALFSLIAGLLALCGPTIQSLYPARLPGYADLILHGLLLGSLCYLLNAILLVTVMCLHEGANPLAIWKERMGWFFPYTLAFGLLAAFMAWAGRAFGPLGLIVFAIPAFMLHLVTKQYVDRTKEHVTALHEAHDRLAALNRDLQSSVTAVEHSYAATLSAFSGMLDARDSETEGHSQRVVAYALAIGQALGLGPRNLAAIEVGALLHDIGKVGVPDAILRKPGKLTEAEWAEMRRHPEIGHQLTSRIPFLDAASPLVRHHHERWDGGGYPDGLRGEDIPLAARIFAVADAYDALVSDRPYRRGRPHHAALEEITRSAGTQFDPQIVTLFVQLATAADWQERACDHAASNTLPVAQLAAR